MQDEVTSFNLRSGTDSFVSRSQDVFAGLVALENKHSAYLKATATSQDDDDSGLIKTDPDEDDEFVNRTENKNLDSEGYRSWSHGRSHCSPGNSDYESRSRSRSPNRDNGSSCGSDESRSDEDSNFKRPAQPPHRSHLKSVPDFRKHPDKYTRYSLEDVSDHDMSDKTNKMAALDFLEERKFERERLERKLAGLPEEEPKFDVADAACSQGKIAFSGLKQKKKQPVTPEKVFSKDSVEVLLSGPDSDVLDNDEESKEPEASSVPVEVESGKSLPDKTTRSNTFKSRRNVRRHIRAKERDADSD